MAEKKYTEKQLRDCMHYAMGNAIGYYVKNKKAPSVSERDLIIDEWVKLYNAIESIN